MNTLLLSTILRLFTSYIKYSIGLQFYKFFKSDFKCKQNTSYLIGNYFT